MTYKLELFLVLQKKAHKYKIIQFFLWFIYIGLLFFYTKLTHLVQKLKKLRLDETRGTKLDFN